ncbi:DUF4760 domain-containing protein [Streptomyces sp. NBC_00162]|uniref:DUF4760 domain-containing protein n=1 Tax=Streptomyces sp. NBC_00162 TaxID=2903629 RepID=UPI00214C3B48|nr:DUF4760 domain-containing protein [Streptomyces sp. NBC_00162]UUU40814.1 DUF4760 domain-containing protein [Streptomyces sp. NBC_00162]
MSLSLALNLLAVLVALAALGTSVAVAQRQLRLAQNSNVLPIVIELFRETREPDFSQAIAYISTRLNTEHSHENGYRRLPPEALGHIRRVSLFYDDVGKLVAHGVVDEVLVIGSYGLNIVSMWDVLAPYIYRERALTTPAMLYFEDLAARAKARPMSAVHTSIGLAQCPPWNGDGPQTAP